MANPATTGPKPVYINNVVTPIGRIAYPHLDKPSAAVGNDKPKYGIELVFAKETDISVLKKAVLDCANQAFGAEVMAIENGQKVKRPRKLSDFIHPFKDGDEKAQELTLADKDGSAYAGTIFIRAKSSRQVEVCDRTRALIPPETVYGGCYGRLVVDVASYLADGNKPAVRFQLRTVQFVRDGEPLGGTGGGGGSAISALPDDLPADEGDAAPAAAAPTAAPAKKSFLD